ncbi:hypothetical protein [Bradyrhizobium genosp. P]|uniref:hypothetical protein n=1 Tax=Bradyrhizobium genosp. P TaxID=83641 RepID=UPI003CFB65B2
MDLDETMRNARQTIAQMDSLLSRVEDQRDQWVRLLDGAAERAASFAAQIDGREEVDYSHELAALSEIMSWSD